MKVIFALLACVCVAIAKPHGKVNASVDSSPAQDASALPKDDVIQQLPKTEIKQPDSAAPKEVDIKQLKNTENQQIPKSEHIPARLTRDLSHSYQTPEGIVRSESVDPATNRITGQVSWRAPDGQPFSVTYQGDYTGYHAQGAHI